MTDQAKATGYAGQAAARRPAGKPLAHIEAAGLPTNAGVPGYAEQAGRAKFALRMEQRAVLGGLADEWRVARSAPASAEDIMAGRAQAGQVWLPLFDWTTREDAEQRARAMGWPGYREPKPPITPTPTRKPMTLTRFSEVEADAAARANQTTNDALLVFADKLTGTPGHDAVVAARKAMAADAPSQAAHALRTAADRAKDAKRFDEAATLTRALATVAPRRPVPEVLMTEKGGPAKFRAWLDERMDALLAKGSALVMTASEAEALVSQARAIGQDATYAPFSDGGYMVALAGVAAPFAEGYAAQRAAFAEHTEKFKR